MNTVMGETIYQLQYLKHLVNDKWKNAAIACSSTLSNDGVCDLISKHQTSTDIGEVIIVCETTAHRDIKLLYQYNGHKMPDSFRASSFSKHVRTRRVHLRPMHPIPLTSAAQTASSPKR